MSYKLKEYCKRGHKLTNKTVRVQRQGEHGEYIKRQCRLCESHMYKKHKEQDNAEKGTR